MKVDRNRGGTIRIKKNPGESLWTDSCFCSKSVPSKLKCLEEFTPAPSSGMRTNYRKCEGPSFQSGRSYAGNKGHKNLPHPSKLSLIDNTKCGQDRENLRIYEKMREQGLRPSISIVLAALKVCSCLRDLQTGKKIHVYVIQSGDDSDMYVANTLVDMYAKCGSMVDACRVFDNMPHHDVVSWNAIILGYAQSGKGELALQLYARMQDEGFAPGRVTFLAALKACGSMAAEEEGKQVEGKLVKVVCLEKGKAIHSQVAKSGHEFGIYVGNTLVDMYAKCGSMADARRVFDRMSHHSVVSWTAMILGYVQSGEGELALQLYARMQDEGCAPNAVTCVAALKACGSLAAVEEGIKVNGKFVRLASLEKGKAIHSEVTKSGHELDIHVANTLIDMYAKCGSMVDARRVFDRMPHHNVVSWTAMILGYAQSGEAELALQFYAHMQDEGCAPDRVTFIAALKACGCLAAEEDGKQVERKLVRLASLEKGITIHSQVAKSGYELDTFLANILVDMYAKCGSMLNARVVFDKMPHPDVVSWTNIILGYAQSGEGELALQLFARMQYEDCAPDSVTFVAALKACVSLAAEEDGKQVEGKLLKVVCLEKGIAIHSQVAKRGHEFDIYVANTLVDMYTKCGSMVDAHGIFDRMSRRSVVSWNAMILGYAQSGESELALQLFARMQGEGCAPDRVTFVAALKACGSLAAEEDGTQVNGKLVKVGCLTKGTDIHSQVARGGLEADIFVANTLVDMYAKCGSMVNAHGVFDKMPDHDVVSWTAIILGYVECGEGELALQLFSRMQDEGCAPDRITFFAALKACGSLAALETGKQIQAELYTAGLKSDAVLANCLVDFYGKCGSMVDAQQIFDSITTKDLVTWNSLIAGYSRQGDDEHVFNLFERMQKERLQPDGITFLSVLTVCSHAGLVDKGMEYFKGMCSDYGITPSIEHYTCMVDLYSRANHLDDAVAMVKKMPYEPNLRIWTTILGACRKWGNVAVGRLAFESILRLDDKEAAAYVLMANIFARAGMWEESAKIQKECSSLEEVVG